MKIIKNIKKLLLDILFPISCLSCGKESDWLCFKCFKKLKFQEKNIKEFNLVIDNLDDLFIAGDYDDLLLANLIKKFKYEKLIGLAKVLSEFLIIYFNGQKQLLFFSNKKLAKDLDEAKIIYIPISKSRKKERGFNQTELLAELFSKNFDLKIYSALKCQKNRHRKHQAKLKEKERLLNIKNNFKVINSKKNLDLKNANVILIDDVITTGATLNEAARVLKEYGVKKVYGLTLAKG